MSVGDRASKAFLVLLSPVIFCWTLYSFWHLATKGTLWVRDHGHVIEVSGGLNFWVTLLLYVVLFVGSIVVLSVATTWLVRRFKGVG